MSTSQAHFAQISQRSVHVAKLLQRRIETAQNRFSERVEKAVQERIPAATTPMANPWSIWSNWAQYATDAAQRSVLFLDTLRQRGNNHLEHEAAGRPPLLHFKCEMVMDARGFEQPVNYALVRIVPPEGVVVGEARRPYLISDPRAGHGPGIGGFKDDSQVGVALRAGHPVYFIIFFPDPEPGQTLPDVCAAEQVFVRKVRELHPASPKPAILGNCQGGWAAMMLAASALQDTGPVVINGAPMSYLGGAWGEGEGDNPMRISGGLLGGSWLASMTADMGNGIFDGAHLVSNFAQLNPANALWGKYYNLYSKVDTEAPRFLEFERWWGGFYLMNKQEIEWIVQNLFVGNKLWSSAAGGPGRVFDLREIRSPIILFASMGDNITPPRQAFNWVADTYGSTDEIKARGQVIVGLLHEDVGHLGIFVSGKVAKKEHAQIVSVLESVGSLPPGLYGMKINEVPGPGGQVEYEVEFTERQVEEVTARLNRFDRKDEAPFEAVAAISQFNQKAYELFAQPMDQAMSNETTAELGRQLNPMRVEQWAASDRNPWLAWTGVAAEAIRAARRPAPDSSPFRRFEGLGSDLIGASLDCCRDTRDASSEALFFQTFGVLFPGLQGPHADKDLLPPLAADQWRSIRGRQEVICHYEPEAALASLPTLLEGEGDRERFLDLLGRLLKDPRVAAGRATARQSAMLERMRALLPPPADKRPRLVAAPKRAAARH